MDLIEVIGFLIGMVALTFILFRRMREERLRRNHPELWEQEEKKRQRNLKELLKAMDLDIVDEEEEEEEPERAPLPRQVQPKRELPSPRQQPAAGPKMAVSPYGTEIKKRAPARKGSIHSIFKDAESIRNAVIAREVLSSPRAVKPYEPLQ